MLQLQPAPATAKNSLLSTGLVRILSGKPDAAEAAPAVTVMEVQLNTLLGGNKE